MLVYGPKKMNPYSKNDQKFFDVTKNISLTHTFDQRFRATKITRVCSRVETVEIIPTFLNTISSEHTLAVQYILVLFALPLYIRIITQQKLL